MGDLIIISHNTNKFQLVVIQIQNNIDSISTSSKRDKALCTGMKKQTIRTTITYNLRWKHNQGLGGFSACRLGVQDLMHENPQYGINKMFVNEGGVGRNWIDVEKNNCCLRN